MKKNEIIQAVKSYNDEQLSSWITAGWDVQPTGAAAGTTLLSHLVALPEGQEALIRLLEKNPRLLAGSNLRAQFPPDFFAEPPSPLHEEDPPPTEVWHHLDKFPPALRIAFYIEINERVKQKTDPRLTDNLTDDGFSVLITALELGNTVDELIIGDNSEISDIGACLLANWLKKSYMPLRKLRWIKTDYITREGARALTTAIGQHGQLTKLCMDFFAFSHSEDFDVACEFERMLEHHVELVECNIGDNYDKWGKGSTSILECLNRVIKRNQHDQGFLKKLQDDVKKIEDKLNCARQANRAAENLDDFSEKLKELLKDILHLKFYYRRIGAVGSDVQVILCNMEINVLMIMLEYYLFTQNYVDFIDVFKKLDEHTLSSEPWLRQKRITITFCDALINGMTSIDTSTRIEKYKLALLLLRFHLLQDDEMRAWVRQRFNEYLALRNNCQEPIPMTDRSLESMLNVDQVLCFSHRMNAQKGAASYVPDRKVAIYEQAILDPDNVQIITYQDDGSLPEVIDYSKITSEELNLLEKVRSEQAFLKSHSDLVLRFEALSERISALNAAEAGVPSAVTASVCATSATLYSIAAAAAAAAGVSATTDVTMSTSVISAAATPSTAHKRTLSDSAKPREAGIGRK